MRDYEEYLVEILESLKNERRAQGVTQLQIAERTGMKAPNIALLETGRRKPSLKVLSRYARALGKDIKLTVEDAAK